MGKKESDNQGLNDSPARQDHPGIGASEGICNLPISAENTVDLESLIRERKAKRLSMAGNFKTLQERVSGKVPIHYFIFWIIVTIGGPLISSTGVSVGVGGIGVAVGSAAVAVGLAVGVSASACTSEAIAESDGLVVVSTITSTNAPPSGVGVNVGCGVRVGVDSASRPISPITDARLQPREVTRSSGKMNTN